MRKSKTLRTHIWIHFMVFTIIILTLLWIFQFFFLQSYYQSMKTRDIKKTATIILNNFGKKNFSELVEEIAFKNNMCIEITDEFGRSLYSEDMMAENCLIHSDNGARLFGFRNDLLKSENGIIYYGFTNERFDTKMLVFGMIIGTKDNVRAYVFLNSSIEPIDSTAAIIKEQLIYITIIILELAFIITMFISKKISKPIVEITKSAKQFAQGDYTVKFDGGDYTEAQQLATALNRAGIEISKVEGLRRDLISNISHDLRTPLTMVKAYAEMIRDLSGDNPIKRERHIKVIIDEADRLSALVNGILEISKFENGNQELTISEFSIHEKLVEILNRYKIFEERDGYNFIFESDKDILVKADVLKIEQVFHNLINNAVNYTGENKNIIIKQINKENCVRIEITDSGSGISKEVLPLIFDRYYRVEKQKREVVGTGLGLAIVKEILKLHSFPFGVQSELEKGSTFWFEFLL